MLSTEASDLGIDNSWYHAQPLPIIAYFSLEVERATVRTWTDLSVFDGMQKKAVCVSVITYLREYIIK